MTGFNSRRELVDFVLRDKAQMDVEKKMSEERYSRLLRVGECPRGVYRIHERDDSGKGDRITYINSQGLIENEVILI